jgi:hypothetical protein
MLQDGGNYAIPKAVGCTFLNLWRLWWSPMSVHVLFVIDKVFLHALRIFPVIFIIKMAHTYLSIIDIV